MTALGVLLTVGIAAEAMAAPTLNAGAELKDPGGIVGGSRLSVDSYGPGKPFAIAEVISGDGSVARGGGWFPGGVLSGYARSSTRDVQLIANSNIVDTLTIRLPPGMSEAMLKFTLAPTARTATLLGETQLTISLGTPAGGSCATADSCASGNGSAPVTATIRVTDGQQVVLSARSSASAVTTDSSRDSIYGVQSRMTLQAPPGVTFTSESGITFDSPPPPGSGPDDPVLPPPGTGTGEIDINDCVFYRVRCFIDPEIAVGYEYSMAAGLSNIESFLLPDDIGDGRYELFLYDSASNTYPTSGISVLGGTVYDFISDFGIAGGVSRFTIRGIETDVGIDPGDFTRFVTGLSFVGSNLDGKLTMTPITVNVGGNAVPEPSTIALTGLALLGFGWRRQADVGA